MKTVSTLQVFILAQMHIVSRQLVVHFNTMPLNTWSSDLNLFKGSQYSIYSTVFSASLIGLSLSRGSRVLIVINGMAEGLVFLKHYGRGDDILYGDYHTRTHTHTLSYYAAKTSFIYIQSGEGYELPFIKEAPFYLSITLLNYFQLSNFYSVLLKINALFMFYIHY